jgi:RTX calcium-binding nonapeptide repeat (4 copies)
MHFRFESAEDGLRDLNTIGFDLSRIKVIATASETKYLDAVGGYPTFEIKSDVGDPLTILQADAGGIQPNDIDIVAKLKFANMLSRFFTFLYEIKGGSGFSEAMEKHSFNDHYAYSGGVPNPKLRSYFSQLFQELHPKGFYFANEDIQSRPNSVTEGTKNDDRLEGSDADDILSGLARNDVLRGRSGNDTLIGDEGYDFLDGGDGADTARYADSPQGIKVTAKNYVGSDIYEVQDGFGTVDTLGNIEIISASAWLTDTSVVRGLKGIYGGG